MQNGMDKGFDPIMKGQDSGVIFETDFCGDVDDVGALALLCKREKETGVPLLGVSINVKHPDIVPAVYRELSFMGKADTPIAVCEKEENRPSLYLEGLAKELTAAQKNAIKTLTVSAFYRKILENAPDHSVSIISVGFFCNLQVALTEMPELFERKVRCIYIMAGSFRYKKGYTEYNVREKLDTALPFLRNCPCHMIFVPFETGVNSMTDFRGFENLTENPVVTAYKLYTKGSMLRPSWDPITVDFAFRGESEYYALSEEGEVEVADNGETFHHPVKGGKSRYIYFKKSNEELGTHITAEIKKAAFID